MARKTAPFTYDDYARLPNDRFIHQVIEGEHYVTPSPVPYHQDISRNILKIVVDWVDSNNLGKIYHAPIDVLFSDINVVVPDLIFISRANTSKILDKYIDGAPDLVVEIISPSTRKIDLDLKLRLYEKFKVPEYWIIDPKTKTVKIHRLIDGAYSEQAPLGENEELTSPTFPGLRIPLGEVFRE